MSATRIHTKPRPMLPAASGPRVVIIGAGPTGLGCARELEALGHTNYVVLERSAGPGGLASSVVDGAGFTWDHGGHVVFSHYGEFDRLIDEVMGDEVYHHDRSSYIRLGDAWVPYPFQNNLHHLPPDLAYECLAGLIETDGHPLAKGMKADTDFATWMEARFGAGITKHFMAPYNFKVWATPAELMSAGWIAERVSVVDWRAALRTVVHGRDDAAWGPNNTFIFPARGGTGEIFRRLALRHADHIRYGAGVTSIDPIARRITLTDGGVEDYDVLVSTMPLDRLIGLVDSSPDQVVDAAGDLAHNGVHVVGVGYETPLRDDRSWLYFPEENVPFYRATNFAKYSPHNVPGGDTDRYCSYMTEVSFSDHKPVDQATLEEEVERGLRTAGVVAGRPPVASINVTTIDYAYPVPTLGRDAALATIQPWLESVGILSRGRFGAWKYEAGNMDHSVKMGIDAARRIVADIPEELWTL